MAYTVGVSELAGRTFGKTQVMTQEQAGRQLRMALIELKRDHGITVTPNECDRSRADQDVVWFEYLNGGALAAVRYTSTHDPINHGNAADLGGAGGAVISDAAVALLDSENPDGRIGKKYGVTQTGKHFARFEKWHFNVFPGQAQVLVTDAMIAAALATVTPGNPSVPDMLEDEDMNTNYVQCIMDGSKYQNAVYAIAADTGNVRHVLEIEERAIARNRGLDRLAWREKYAEKINGKQVDELFANNGGEKKPGFLGTVKGA